MAIEMGMNNKRTKYYSAALLILVLAFANSQLKKSTSQEVVTEETPEEVKSETPVRKPSSKKTELFKAGMAKAKIDNSFFKSTAPLEEENLLEEMPEKETRYISTITKTEPTLYREDIEGISFNPKKSENKKTEQPIGFIKIADQPKKKEKIPKSNLPTSYGPMPSASPSITINICSANISGGTFNYPISVNLNCSSQSDIKYCVGIDTGSGCCDPQMTGNDYSTPIIIGPRAGNYCLSYYGESDSAGISDIYQHSYSLNVAVPNLQVIHPQIYYQTTQLNGKSLITSSEFGKIGFSLGQVNLKNHDPSPSAENLSCEQIVENYVSLLNPNPLATLLTYDVSLDNPLLQIEIPLRPDHLDYGDNFITSFITNKNFAAPIYACSTTKIVLEDFEFFQSELTFGDVGDNDVREFTAGLSSYGFFEDENTVFRGPAGESTEDNSGQKLQSELFGIFY
jgi:hypothetical protein